MDQTLQSGNIGDVGSESVAIVGGKFVVTATLKAGLGPEGVYGEVSSQNTVTVSGAALLNAAAKKIGGPIPEAVAAFFESALGIS